MEINTHRLGLQPENRVDDVIIRGEREDLELGLGIGLSLDGHLHDHTQQTQAARHRAELRRWPAVVAHVAAGDHHLDARHHVDEQRLPLCVRPVRGRGKHTAHGERVVVWERHGWDALPSPLQCQNQVVEGHGGADGDAAVGIVPADDGWHVELQRDGFGGGAALNWTTGTSKRGRGVEVAVFKCVWVVVEVCA